MNDQEENNGELKGGGIKSRAQLYAMFSPHAELAVRTLVEACQKGNPAVRVGAAKTILAKLVPDLKSTEITGADGQQFIINVISDYFTQTRGNVPSSNTSAQGSEPVQSSDMAQTSKENIDITREDGTGVS